MILHITVAIRGLYILYFEPCKRGAGMYLVIFTMILASTVCCIHNLGMARTVLLEERGEVYQLSSSTMIQLLTKEVSSEIRSCSEVISPMYIIHSCHNLTTSLLHHRPIIHDPPGSYNNNSLLVINFAHNGHIDSTPTN